MSQTTCIDLNPLGLGGIVGCYVIDALEPTVVDPGPAPSAERLITELAALGMGARDLKHIVLTHFHLDHAGAAGYLVERFPNARVHIHADVASHMVDPTELVANTRQAFGPATDILWGDVKPIPTHRIREWHPGDAGPWKGLRPVASPGHIAHHVSYLDERDGTLYSGDSMGVALSGSPPHPMGPPPNVDLPAWFATIAAVAVIGPTRIAPTHFGYRTDVEWYRAELERRLEDMATRAGAALAAGDPSRAEEFDKEIREEMSAYMGQARGKAYFDMFPPKNDWGGVRHYLESHP